MASFTPFEPPRKRARTSGVCAQCKRGKVRCEPAGRACHRCTTLGKECSFLAEQTHSESSSPAMPLPMIPSSTSISSSPHLERNALLISAEIVEKVSRHIAQLMVARSVPTSPDDEPVIILPEPDGADTTPLARRLTWLKPLDSTVRLLALTWPNELRSSSHSFKDSRWLARSTPLTSDLQDVAEAQDAANWTTNLTDARKLFQLSEQASISLLRLRRAESGGLESSSEARMLHASLLITNAAISLLDFDISLNFVASVRALLTDLDPQNGDVQMLSIHTTLLAALARCSPTEDEHDKVGPDATLAILQHRLRDMEDAFCDARIAHALAGPQDGPYFLGLLIFASSYRVLAQMRVLRKTIQLINHTRTSDPQTCRRILGNEFRRWGYLIKPLNVEALSHMLSMATWYPSQLATAPDLMFVCIAFAAECNVRSEMNVREFTGAMSDIALRKARMLKMLASALVPSGQSPLHSRPLATCVGRLCAASAEVLEGAMLPSLTLEDLIGFNWTQL